jgi:hypothetical protein
MKSHLSVVREALSQPGEPTSAFDDKLAGILLMVIKRAYGFAARKQLTDGD